MKVYVATLLGGNQDSEWTHIIGVYRHQRSAADAGSRLARRCNEFLRGVPKWNAGERPMSYDRMLVAFKDDYHDLSEVDYLYDENVFVGDELEVTFQVLETKMMEMK